MGKLYQSPIQKKSKSKTNEKKTQKMIRWSYNKYLMGKSKLNEDN